MRILVIDDSLAMRNLLMGLCGEAGATAVPAVDGQDALEVLEREPRFDAALVDWDMPRVNGLEFVRRARADQRWKAMKLLMVTAHIGQTDVVEALGAGADDYLMKPVAPEMLEAKLRILGLVA